MVTFEVGTVSTRTAIETIHPRVGHQLYQVLVALVVLGKHDEVVTAAVTVFTHLVLLAVARHIHLASEDGLERFKPFLCPFPVNAITAVEEFLYAEHVAVVGYGHTLHAVGNSLVNELRNARLSVEYGVVCMYM